MTNATPMPTKNLHQVTQPPVFFDQIVHVLQAHRVMTLEEVHAIALWTMASCAINDARVFPELTLVSTERRCGKTTALELIGKFPRSEG